MGDVPVMRNYRVNGMKPQLSFPAKLFYMDKIALKKYQSNRRRIL
jgi:hypothetical protein